MTQAALSIRHLSHSYGARKALDDVSFDVAPGTFTVLLGLNGAGKSTLFSLVTRLYAAKQGEIDILGANVMRVPRVALRQLGVVFQARTLDLELSLMQNLVYHAALHGIGPLEARRLGLAMLTGNPMDTTLQPQFVASMQATYDQAAEIFDRMSLTPDYPEFLTLPLYEAMA